MQVPPGFPPISFYWLTSERIGSGELVIEGPQPFNSVYKRRIRLEPGVNRFVVFPSDGYCIQCEEGCPSCQPARIDYLAELAQITNREVAGAADPVTEVAWENSAQISATITQALAAQVAAMRGVARQLVSAGAMDVAALDMTLHIEIRVGDWRSVRPTPLPRIQPVRFQLR
jgi:hypothetical protein